MNRFRISILRACHIEAGCRCYTRCFATSTKRYLFKIILKKRGGLKVGGGVATGYYLRDIESMA